MPDIDTSATTTTPAANSTPSANPAATATTTSTTATASPWDELGSFDDVKKQLEHARTWESRAKQNADAVKKLAAIEDAQKTETQKLADQLAAANKELDEHRGNAVRIAAAREAGLGLDMAQFITATDPDAALKQAKTLAKKIAPPKADLKQGARPAATTAQDMNAWLRRQAGYGPTNT